MLTLRSQKITITSASINTSMKCDVRQRSGCAYFHTSNCGRIHLFKTTVVTFSIHAYPANSQSYFSDHMFLIVKPPANTVGFAIALRLRKKISEDCCVGVNNISK